MTSRLHFCSSLLASRFVLASSPLLVGIAGRGCGVRGSAGSGGGEVGWGKGEGERGGGGGGGLATGVQMDSWWSV